MDKNVPLTDVSKPEQLRTLVDALSEMSDELDVLYSTTAPNGSISARQGRMCLYYTGSAYQLWLNTDGATTWAQITNQTDFVTGDLILSTVATAHSGWTDVSATYSNKFMRINETPLSTGGADTDSITLTTNELPAHTHTGPSHDHSTPAHTHTVAYNASGGLNQVFNVSLNSDTPSGISTGNPPGTTEGGGTSGSGGTGDTGSAGSGNSFTVDTVPAYVTVAAFKKD